MRYSRSLSPDFVRHLSREPLSGLLRLSTESGIDDPFAIDLHLREGDRLMFYHGTTALLTIQFDPATNCLRCSAANAYAGASRFQELMQTWPESEWSRSLDVISEYLSSAMSVANDGDYRNRAEGYWQNRLSLAFGPQWCPGMDWLIIDREAVVGFMNSAEKQQLLDPIQQKYQSIRDQLRAQDARIWGEPSRRKFGDECDFLALGPAGELFCIELKHGSNASGIYWGCLQVTVYRDLFEQALGQITEEIKALVQQKIQLGLLPPQATRRLPEGSFRTVQPILAIAEPNDRSSCWDRLQEVMALCPEAKCSVVEFPVPTTRLQFPGCEASRRHHASWMPFP